MKKNTLLLGLLLSTILVSCGKNQNDLQTEYVSRFALAPELANRVGEIASQIRCPNGGERFERHYMMDQSGTQATIPGATVVASNASNTFGGISTIGQLYSTGALSGVLYNAVSSDAILNGNTYYGSRGVALSLDPQTGTFIIAHNLQATNQAAGNSNVYAAMASAYTVSYCTGPTYFYNDEQIATTNRIVVGAVQASNLGNACQFIANSLALSLPDFRSLLGSVAMVSYPLPYLHRNNILQIEASDSPAVQEAITCGNV